MIMYDGITINQADFPSENRRGTSVKATSTNYDGEEASGPDPLVNCTELLESANLVFTAYSMLRAKNQVRLSQLIMWLGVGFDGMVSLFIVSVSRLENERENV